MGWGDDRGPSSWIYLYENVTKSIVLSDWYMLRKCVFCWFLHRRIQNAKCCSISKDMLRKYCSTRCGVSSELCHIVYLVMSKGVSVSGWVSVPEHSWRNKRVPSYCIFNFLGAQNWTYVLTHAGQACYHQVIIPGLYLMCSWLLDIAMVLQCLLKWIFATMCFP